MNKLSPMLKKQLSYVPRLSYRNYGIKANMLKVTSSCTVPTIRQNIQYQRFYSTNDNKSATLKVDDPQLMIAFTCKKCDTRSSHTFSKQAYTKGTVAIQCPGCKNRHLIADNLKIFKDERFSLEDILKAKGESIASTTDDLVFNDIPESLKKTIGHHAKDAPEEYQAKDIEDVGLPKGKE